MKKIILGLVLLIPFSVSADDSVENEQWTTSKWAAGSFDVGKFMVNCTASEKMTVEEYRTTIGDELIIMDRKLKSGEIENFYWKKNLDGVVFFVNAPDGKEQLKEILNELPFHRMSKEKNNCVHTEVGILWKVSK
jgi:hypothetical protein